MKIKYAGDGGDAKLYTFPQYIFPYDEWVKVEDWEGKRILEDYAGFIKQEAKKKEDKKDGVINI